MINPQLSLTFAQYAPWNASIKAIAGTSYLEGVKKENKTQPNRPKVWVDEYKEPKMMFYMESDSGQKYFFDAVLKTEHNLRRTITSHPVQIGANITDHSFQQPVRLSLEIGVSDSMDCYSKEDDWTGSVTINGYSCRSINAYQELRRIMNSGNPMTVHTRIETYDNMIIESITVPEDFKTKYELRASILFQEIITVEASRTKTSTKEWTTLQTNGGGKNPIAVPSVRSVPNKILKKVGGQ